jgi:hypothetical protein
MTRSTLVLTVLGAAAALAVVGCGSVAAPGASDAGNPSAASGHASATTPPGGRTSPGTSTGTAAPSPGQANGTGGPLGGISGLLCAAPGSVSQVMITRTGFGGPVLPSGPRVAAFRAPGTTRASGRAASLASGTPPSAGPVVLGPAPASALARAVCGLPLMSGGLLHCPQQTTASYRLTFTAGGRLLPAVVVQPSGCETVTGAGGPRTVARDPAFLKKLATMAGPLPLPGAVHLPGTAVSGGPLRPLAARA